VSPEPSRAAEFDAVIADRGVVLFGADTVYGLACDPENEEAIARLYALKRRPPEQAAAIMFFDLGAALAALPQLGARTRAGLERLLPGGVTVLLPNPERRYPRAGGDALGLRVVDVPPLRGARRAVLQSSANHHGDPAPRRLAAVHPEIRDGVDLTVDAGELPGTASTVVDLRRYEASGAFSVLRAGAVSPEDLSAALVP
jgi:L-threonylcarbamoyladenylate synthase